jgi:uncharacterized membrane protein (DUF2068 family)
MRPAFRHPAPFIAWRLEQALAPGIVVVQRSDRILVGIGVFKLLKCALLVAIGLCALWLHGRDVEHQVTVWVNSLGLDPGNRYLERILWKIGALQPKRFEELGIGSLCYAVLFAIEGTGLVRRRVWAEYLTVAITASFLPLEIYEIVEHASVAKGIVSAANAAILCYLIARLRRDGRWPFR